jgi:hypothetical protein
VSSTRVPTRPSPTSNTPPPAGSTGTTTAGSTGHWAWSRPQNTRMPTTLPSHRRSSPYETGTKVVTVHPGRLRRHPPPTVGGRRRTPTRRSPRRSPLVAHPRPATGNTEPRPRNPPRDPRDQAHHEAIPPAATRAALGAATGIRPEPLNRPPDAEPRRDVSAGSVAETHSDMDQGSLAVLGCSLRVSSLRCGPRRGS